MAIIILVLTCVAFDHYDIESPSDNTAGMLIWVAILHDFIWLTDKFVSIFG